MGNEIKVTNYAPIAIFAYNRADRLSALIHSLEKNDNTEEIDLYIFVDIPDKRSKKDRIYNSEVLQFVEYYKKQNVRFRKVIVEVAQKHKGLANAIIFGVSKVVNEYGKVIVLEDDLEVSNDFLDYMQRGLEFYQNDERVNSLAGYCPEIKHCFPYKKDIFLVPRAESWGWGTWKERWNRTDWEVKSYVKFQKDIIGQLLFNLGGSDLCKMLKDQMADESYNSWAIRWCYQQFRERKYTVYPIESRVIHCGNDNRSTHCQGWNSTQKLKQNYKKCQFEHVNPNLRMIWKFRRATNIENKNSMEKNVVKSKVLRRVNDIWKCWSK
ncbi:hypothetical protein IMSAGC009_04495 [Lachnospiraceae bacterium]|nr:hypothetical protein IMSAGC009_04495 [Lachnospiraceae bacterium]